MSRGQVIKPNGGRSWAVRWHDSDGKRRSKGGFRTKTEAVAFLDERLKEQRLGHLYRPTLLMSEVTARFMATYAKAPSTIERMRYMLRLVDRDFGDRRVADIRPEEIDAWRAGLREGTRFNAVQALRQTLDWAIRMRIVADNPAREIKNPRPKANEVTPFESWEEVHAVGAELHPEFRLIPLLAVGTGLRPGEWMALEARDIDLDHRMLYVKRALDSSTRTLRPPKTGPRSVPLRGSIVEALGGIRGRAGRDLVFPAIEGGHIELHNWRNREWNPAVEAAGIEHRTPYAMRHTYAAMSLRAGVNTFQLGRRMGTSLEMIERTYGHLAVDSAEHEIRLLDAFDGL